MCRREGYEPVIFEDILMTQEWSLVKHASSIMSIHGATPGYLNDRGFAGTSPHVEMLGTSSSDLVAGCYRKMSALVGGHWIGCRGAVTSALHHGVEESGKCKAMDSADFDLDAGTLALAFEKLRLRA